MKFITNRVNSAGILGLVAVVVLLAMYVGYTNRSAIIDRTPLIGDQGRITLPTTATSTPVTEGEDEPGTPAEPEPERGVYQTYSESRVAAAPPGAQIVLFFWSERCATCQGLDEALHTTVDQMPSDVYIFRVDYERSLELRREFAVRGPHTLVEIDDFGNLVQRWSGSMTLDAILARI